MIASKGKESTLMGLLKERKMDTDIRIIQDYINRKGCTTQKQALEALARIALRLKS